MHVALRVIGLVVLVGAASWFTAACNEDDGEPDAVLVGWAVPAEPAPAPLSYRPALTDKQAPVDHSPDPRLRSRPSTTRCCPTSAYSSPPPSTLSTSGPQATDA